MNFHELVPIEVTRVDPETNVQYSFKASPPIDITILTRDPTNSLADFLVSFSWRWLAGLWEDSIYENFPDTHKQIVDILPILLVVVGDIKINYLNEGEMVDFQNRQDFEIVIDRENSTRWEGIVPHPSPNFLDSLEREIMESPAVQLGIRAFITVKFSEIVEEYAKNTKADDRPTKPTNNTVWAMNGLGQLFTPPSQKGKILKQSVESWQEQTGQRIEQPILNYGIDLNEIPLRVLEGVLWQFSKTNYKGNVEPKSKEEELKKFKALKSVDELPRVFQNIKEIPRIQIGKRELLRLAGMNYDNQGDVDRAVKALMELGATQFCFYYTRLSINKEGKAEKDKDGDWKKESVTAIDTLLDVRTVRDEKTGQLKYYEISPSPIFLDQKEKYFMLIPFGWRKEVEMLVGTKKASSYTYLFLLYLRYQFEQKRRKNARAKPSARQRYEIVSSWVNIAQALRMPESIYKRKPDRALSILDNAYSAAKQLGYLTNYSRTDHIDRLVLNPEKYPASTLEIESEN
ncbi:hypothetical protein [Spirosoma sp. 48-14]|uniref:hypothetical protein n=1 Tax=Spirosoma sp. 48-14 TaxID=1895854 RepID=UPI000AB3FF59|nr:hypothetical protein [Spirosoma sp. 48-14]